MTRTDRIQIKYTLEFCSPFHCGTGVREGLIDRSVMRDGDGYLYVPGTTIKGVVRELCEQLARFYEDSDVKLRDRIASPHDKAIALSDLGSKPTLVTRIFGSQIRPGHLFFNDAQQTKKDKERYDAKDRDKGEKRYQNMQTDLSTQVRLDRPTRTAVPGALYSSEFGVRKMAFEGSIVGTLECLPLHQDVDEFFMKQHNEPTYSLLLLLAGLSMVERLGGNKSTGKGECRCMIKKLKLNGVEIDQERRKDWLHHLRVLSYYSLMLEEEA
jgi:CRISPR/Cas system CSM-associated protein Csm3 (group 7 of RAMP superfamily)